MIDDWHPHLEEMINCFYRSYTWPQTVDPKLVWDRADRVLSEEQHRIFSALWRRDGTPIRFPSDAAAARALELTIWKFGGRKWKAIWAILEPMRSNPFVFDYPVIQVAKFEYGSIEYGYA